MSKCVSPNYFEILSRITTWLALRYKQMRFSLHYVFKMIYLSTTIKSCMTRHSIFRRKSSVSFSNECPIHGKLFAKHLTCSQYFLINSEAWVIRFHDPIYRLLLHLHIILSLRMWLFIMCVYNKYVKQNNTLLSQSRYCIVVSISGLFRCTWKTVIFQHIHNMLFCFKQFLSVPLFGLFWDEGTRYF